MRAVAKGRRLGAFALTPADRNFLRRHEFHRLQARAFMRAVAKRRMSGSAAGTPKMHAGLHFEDQRLVVTGDRLLRHADYLSASTSSLASFSSSESKGLEESREVPFFAETGTEPFPRFG